LNSKSASPQWHTSILIIDDEIAFCTVLREILSPRGYDVRTAHRASEALHILKSFTPDVILTDIMMPELDGLSLVRQIRDLPRFAETPIVVVSAKSMQEDHEEALQAGANELLSKPFTSQELLLTIQRHLNTTHPPQ